MLSLQDIIRTARNKGYTIDTRPFALNVIGVRNSNATDQKNFDDVLAYFYYDASGRLVGNVAKATTDPATYFLENPINPMGAAVLKAGEYRDTYSIGLHRGKYEALVQNLKPVTTIRDSDRNALINYFAPTTTGFYGINIHRASLNKDNITIIDKDSAGCQVFQNSKDFDQMMQYAKNARALYGNKFSYILLDERDNIKVRNTAFLGVVGVALVAYSVYLLQKGKKR